MVAIQNGMHLWQFKRKREREKEWASWCSIKNHRSIDMVVVTSCLYYNSTTPHIRATMKIWNVSVTMSSDVPIARGCIVLTACARFPFPTRLNFNSEILLWSGFYLKDFKSGKISLERSWSLNEKPANNLDRGLFKIVSLIDWAKFNQSGIKSIDLKRTKSQSKLNQKLNTIKQNKKKTNHKSRIYWFRVSLFGTGSLSISFIQCVD